MAARRAALKPPLPRLHAVTDERIARRPGLGEVARELAQEGLAFHARGRALTGLQHYELAGRLAATVRESFRNRPPARLFVNDRLDIALATGAAGVHLGRGSLSVSAARSLAPQWWIGVSVHDLSEAEAAKAAGADYLFVGPVYATATHPERAPLGLDRLAAIAALGIPVIAIGGVTPERVQGIRKAGAYGAAAIRALWDAALPGAAARAMLKELEP